MNQPSPYPSFAEPFPGAQPSQFGGPPVFSANTGMVSPYGYGAAQQAPGYGTPPRRRRTGLIVGCCVAVLSTVAIAGLGSWLVFRTDPEETAIRAVTADIRSALVAGDIDGVARDICTEESGSLKDVPGSSSKTGANGSHSAVDAQLRDVTVRGEVATAVSTAKEGSGVNFYFRKEGGAWKVCSTAKKDFDAAA
jgi:hypothetical protein